MSVGVLDAVVMIGLVLRVWCGEAAVDAASDQSIFARMTIMKDN